MKYRNLTILGLQWGDEGKGKVTDYLSRFFKGVVRFQGGNNAGHTILRGGRKVVLHLVPSGIFNKGCLCVIAEGVLFAPATFLEEVRTLESMGVEGVRERIKVSPRCQVIMPYHVRLDILREEKGRGIGTTRRGIGPACEDFVGRRGITLSEIAEPVRLKERLEAFLPEKNADISTLGGERLTAEEIVREYAGFGEEIRGFFSDTSSLLYGQMEAGERFLFEGSQGALLDVRAGTYPFVTSTGTLSWAVSAGTGLPPGVEGVVLGILKGYTTRVGDGPFPTCMGEEDGRRLRERGGEFGATTGRPRRCGWLDGVLLRYSCGLNDCSFLGITKLDVLTGMEEVRICTSYRGGKAPGRGFTPLPAAEELERVEPEYISLPSWKGLPSGSDGVSGLEDFPGELRRFVQTVEGITSRRVALLSWGEGREGTWVDRDLLELQERGEIDFTG